MAAAIPYVAAAIFSYAAYESNQNQKAAARAQQGVIQGQRGMQDLQVRQARVQARIQARAARALALSAGEAAGIAPDSSAIVGSTGSAAMTGVNNQNFLGGSGAWQGYVLDKQSDVVDAQQQVSKWQAIGSLASTVFSASGGIKIK